MIDAEMAYKESLAKLEEVQTIDELLEIDKKIKNATEGGFFTCLAGPYHVLKAEKLAIELEEFGYQAMTEFRNTFTEDGQPLIHVCINWRYNPTSESKVKVVHAKVFEIRDRMSFIPVLAVEMASKIEAESYLFRRTGYPHEKPLVMVMRLTDLKAEYSFNNWTNRTMKNAHRYIQEFWPGLKTGDVVDVEYILGESLAVKESERFSLT